MSLISTSTLAASNTQTLLHLATSGANSTSTQTTYGLDVSNTHTGTSSTNIAGRFTASGGTNNYAAIFSGFVGMGTSTPTNPLDINFSDGTGAYSGLNVKNTSTANNAAYAGIDISAQNGTVAGGIVAVPTAGSVLSGGGLVFRTTTNHSLALTTNNLVRLTIANTGDATFTPIPTTGSGVSITNSTVTSGNLLSITKTGTAALTGATGLNISFSGANATGGQTTYAAQFSNTSTGTSTNIGGYFIANGGTNNYPLVAEGGFGAGGLMFGGRSATDGAIWSRAVTPTTNNYAFTTTGGNTVVNATTGVFIAINNVINAISTSATNVDIGVAPTTGNGFSFANTSLTTGNLMSLSSTSTANTSTSATILNISKSGTHAASSVTSYGAQISVTNAGTTSTNYGLLITASGATNNYPLAAMGSSTHGIIRVNVGQQSLQVGDWTNTGFGSKIQWLRPSGATVATSLSQGNATFTLDNAAGGFAFGQSVNIGNLTAPISALTIPVAPTATANYATVSLGDQGFAGGGSNFTGHASGTYLGANAVTGYAGNFLDFQKIGVSSFAVSALGKISLLNTITAGGTTGNQTIDKPSGTVNIAAAGTTVTVTNSTCTTSSIVHAVIRTNDATAYIKNVVPGSGSFVINLGAAATAEISVGFIVFN